MDILSRILDELGLSYTDVAIPSTSARKEILYVDLIDFYISQGNSTNAQEILGISKSALETYISRHLKDVLPSKAKTAKWDLTFLALVGLGKCSMCKIILPLAEVKSGKNNSCKGCVNTRARQYRMENPEKIADSSKKYRETHPTEVKESYKKWAINNSGYLKQKHAKRRIALINASYKFNYGEQEEIDIINFYANCPEGYHVDHIVPLQHSKVCGLHVMANLQYLPSAENIRKSNRFEN